MVGSPVNALFHAIDKVYAPLLLQQSGQWGECFDSKLQNLLGDLSAGLGRALRVDRTGAGHDGIAAVNTPVDEAEYWADFAQLSSSIHDRERAQEFHSILSPVCRDFDLLQSTEWHGALELLERVQVALDEAWQSVGTFEYPLDRMCRLLEVMGMAIAAFIPQRLQSVELFGGEFQSARDELRQAQVVTSRWFSLCRELTGVIWKSSGAHTWHAEPYIDPRVQAIAKRLEEISAIRTQHEQMLRLLSPEEQSLLGFDGVLDRFKNETVLYCNAYTEPLWRTLVTHYEQAVLPAESKVAEKLRAHLAASSSAQQRLREFQRYFTLISRPAVSKELVSEREMLLAQLDSQMRTVREEFSACAQGGTASVPVGKNETPVTSSIQWSQQLIIRAEETISVAESMLSDLSGMEDFTSFAVDILDDVRAFQKHCFEQWCDETSSALKDSSADNGLALEATGRLMDFEHADGKLVVHYSDRLVCLRREVRHLSALGFSVPAGIKAAAKTAQDFHRYGVILKQVAHFYNTIQDQIIDSQMLMLETYARSLESVVKGPKGNSQDRVVTWASTAEVERYVGELQRAAEQLTTENRKLRKYHDIFTEKVVGLFSIDLLRNQDKWKDSVLNMRTMAADLIAQHYTPASLKPWQIHWDHQIYKAMEHQYQLGLESLNENLAEIKVDLTFRQRRLQFKPALEDIRVKYYREMKKFIQLPEKVHGLSDTGIFARLSNQNAPALKIVYEKAESLFTRLSKVLDHYQNYVVLGMVDIEGLVADSLVQVADWEYNFKLVKVKGREAEKLPNTIKVDCITVSMAPLKAAVDDQINRLFEALLTSLRKSIGKSVSEIEGFIDRGMEALSARPTTVEEIGQTNAVHAEIAKEKPAIKPLFQAVETKNALLRSVVGAPVDVELLEERWDKFEVLFMSHEMMIKEQIEVMKNGVEARVDAFTRNLEKFKSKWDALKPSDDAMESRTSAVNAVKIIKDRRNELSELLKEHESIMTDCEHFQLPQPNVQLVTEIQQELDSAAELWILFDEFSTGLQKLADEEWIVFRSHMFDFNDFLDGWLGRLKEHPTNVVTIRLRKDIDRFQELAPLLKYLRGDQYSPSHWGGSLPDN